MRDGVTVYDDLYVMQNEHGLIKIGHSLDTEKRRRALENSESCRIATVFILPGKGPREAAIHLKLKRFRIEGEWFEGHDKARLAVQKALNKGDPIEWPFPMAEAGAGAWLDQLYDRRARRYRLGEVQRFLRGSFGFNPDRSTDARLWRLFWITETGEEPLVDVAGDGDNPTYSGWREGAETSVVIPHYSTNLGAAMSLWPIDLRPAEFDGTAFDCCIAALRIRAARMP